MTSEPVSEILAAFESLQEPLQERLRMPMVFWNLTE